MIPRGRFASFPTGPEQSSVPAAVGSEWGDRKGEFKSPQLTWAVILSSSGPGVIGALVTGLAAGLITRFASPTPPSQPKPAHRQRSPCMIHRPTAATDTRPA